MAVSFSLEDCSSLDDLQNILSTAKKRAGGLQGHLYTVEGREYEFSSSDIGRAFLTLCQKGPVDPEKVSSIYAKLCELDPDIQKNPQVGEVVERLLGPKRPQQAMLETQPKSGQRDPLDDVFILGEGTVVITPTQDPLKKTIAIKITDEQGENSYVKLRNIDVRIREEEIQKPTYNAKEWYTVGSGSSAILINAAQTKLECSAEKKLSALLTVLYPLTRSETTVHRLFGDNKSTLPEIFARVLPGASLTSEEKEEVLKTFRQQFKVTSIMTPEGDLLPVFSRIIKTGTSKIVKEIIVLQRIYPEHSLHFIVAKNAEGVKRDELLREVRISNFLRKNHVPFMLQILAIQRADSAKAGLMMETCTHGNLYDYIGNHFDPITNKVLPQFREEHKRLILQVAEGLSIMNALGLVHADIKPENILLTLTPAGALEVRICDFGITIEKGALISAPYGTFPPPEQQEVCVPELNENHRVKEQGFGLTPTTDAWAFGLVLFDMMHSARDTINTMGSFETASRITSARDSLLRFLDPNDAIDVVIWKLLDSNPERRISVEEALHQLLSCTIN